MQARVGNTVAVITIIIALDVKSQTESLPDKELQHTKCPRAQNNDHLVSYRIWVVVKGFNLSYHNRDL